VLLGVDIPGVPGGPYNVFYSVGRTVTRAQVASLAGDLPDGGAAFRRPAGLVRNRAEFSSVGSGAKRWIG
jgi:hypothetical protein